MQSYKALQLFTLRLPSLPPPLSVWLEVGRWLGAATVIIGTSALLWNRLVHEWRLIRLRRWRDHYVICGMGYRGMEILRWLKERKPEGGKRRGKIVMIDPNPDPILTEQAARAGACILTEDATLPAVLEQARVAHAREVFAITPVEETSHQRSLAQLEWSMCLLMIVLSDLVPCPRQTGQARRKAPHSPPPSATPVR